jgi:hypothetical protein
LEVVVGFIEIRNLEARKEEVFGSRQAKQRDQSD